MWSERQRQREVPFASCVKTRKYEAPEKNMNQGRKALTLRTNL